MDTTPGHCAFYFQGFRLLYPLVEPSQVLCIRLMYIALQELQVVALMMHRMDFCFFHKVVALHLDGIGGKASLFM